LDQARMTQNGHRRPEIPQCSGLLPRCHVLSWEAQVAAHRPSSRNYRMSYQTIELRKSAPSIGAEIFGVDLSKPLGNQQFQEVHDALMDRLVIFFRDQKLSVEQHMDFGRRFGKLHRHPASPDVLPDHPEVLVIKVDDKAKYIPGEDWHSDVSCDPEP